ncbi:aspartic peptidase domain-containing protein [Phyllosticta citribraziliensis]|uniref:Aspartic peptidase domain-containing protein n=1 Tax=Phyllosticta citribraziliensis TaxID=989973 RepID=A0ABR1L9U7_9PEZI
MRAFLYLIGYSSASLLALSLACLLKSRRLGLISNLYFQTFSAALIALRCERFGSKMFSRLAKLISRLDHFASGEIMSWRRRPTLEARDMKESKIPAIPIKETQLFDGPDKSWSTFWLNIGNSTTDIRVLPSTSLSWIVAINSVGCENGSEDCQDSRGQFYNPETAAAPLGNVGMGSSTLQEPSINASLVSDYVSFPESLKNIHAVSQAIANIGQIEYWVGLFPLNPRTNSVSAISNKYPSLLQTLKNQSQIPSLSWGYTAGANYKSSKVYGSLTLGGYDSSRFDNTTKVEGAFTDDPAQDFTVSLVSITTPTFDLLTAQPTTTVIDSTLPYFYFPQDLCDKFSQKLGLTWNKTAGLYLLTEEQKNNLSTSVENMTFVLRDFSTQSEDSSLVPFVFPVSAFLLNASLNEISPRLSGWSWYFPLKPAAVNTSPTLGRAFLQEAYIVADYERNRFSISPATWPDDLTYTPSYHTIHPVSESGREGLDGLSAGALAGTIVGGIIGGLILACIVLQWYRHRPRNRRYSFKPMCPSEMGPIGSPTSGGQSRASSLIASLFPFRNPWGDRDCSRAQEDKQELGNELDANSTGVYEMYQPKCAVQEVQGDSSAAANGHARTNSSSIDPRNAFEDSAQRKALFEMEAISVEPSSQGASPISMSSLPSPSSTEVAERHRTAAEKQRQERWPEAGQRRTSGQSSVSAPSPCTTNERRVSDRSLVSLSVFSDVGIGTLNSNFAENPVSPSSASAGAEAPPSPWTRRDREEGGGCEGSGCHAEASDKQPALTTKRSRSANEGLLNLGAITEDRERESGSLMKAQ